MPLQTRRLGLLAAVTALAVLALAACGGQPAGKPAPPASPSPTTVPVTVTTLDDQTLRIPGPQPTVALFFTPGCSSCAAAAREVAIARQRAGDAARFVAVDMNASDEATVIRDFLATAGARDLPATVDRDAQLTQTFGINALGTVVIIAPDGAVTYRGVEPTADRITRAVRQGGTP
jgi:thiol-disulfide isomerase/thioredoxin